jgi:apolipoprotein N-acyltransferase
VAPGLILFSASKKRASEALRIGYVGGLAYALVAFYWLLHIPFPAGAIAGWLALGAYLALYTAVWVWLCWTLAPTSSAAQATNGVQPKISPSALARAIWAISCAALWVSLEMLLARLFTGFPWNLLGASQYQILPLLQVASITGVYGVSFLAVWFSVSLANACGRLIANPTAGRVWLGDLLLPFVALMAVIAFGSTKLAERHPPARTLKAVLIQPSIPQTLIWDTNQNSIRFEQLVELSERALTATTNAQLLVWPEAAVPNMLRYDFDTYSAVTNLALRHHVWVVLGSDDAELRDSGPDKREFDFYNSSFLVSPAGKITVGYRKRRLVIFGEYIPLERWLPFMKYLTPVGGSFAAGVRARPFPMPDLRVTTSVLICFEDTFPHVARADIQPDTDFLLNLTNNGWFGESAAQWQHAANAVFRAVENRIPLVRCANNGLTCWVDAYGGMHDVYFPGSTDVYAAGYKTADVPLLPTGELRSPTFYTRRGDWFGWGCVSVVGLRLAWFAARSWRGRARTPLRGVA